MPGNNQGKKKWVWRMSMIIVLVFLLFGCSQNQLGGYGPAWDVGFKVPLTAGQGIDVAEFVAEQNLTGVNLDGDIVRYDLGESLTSISIGQLLDDIQLADISETFQNGPIVLQNPLSIGQQQIQLTPGLNNKESTIDTITFSEFTSITFTGDPGNRMIVTLDNPTDVTVESLTIGFYDSGGNPVGVPAEFIDPVNPGSTATAEINLKNATLPKSIDVKVRVSTAAGGTGGNATISFAMSSAEVSDLVDYQMTEAVRVTDSTTLDFSGIYQSLPQELSNSTFKAVTFGSGNLNLGILPPDGSGLAVNINSIDLGGISGASGSLDLTGQTMNINAGSSIDVIYDINLSGTSVTYHASDLFAISGNFDPAITISSLAGDFNISMQTSEVLNNLDMPELITYVELNDAIINLIAENNTGFTAGYSLSFVARDQNGTQIGDYQLTGDLTGGRNEIAILNNNDNSLWDLIQLRPSSLELLTDFNFIADTVIDRNDSLELSLTGEIPVNFNLTSDQEFKFPAQPVDNLSAEQIELIRQGVDHGKLVVIFDNQLPADVRIDFYLAVVPNPGAMSQEEIDNLVYQNDNLLAYVEIQERTEDKVEAVISGEDLELLVSDNLYAGLKITIQAGEMVLESDDYINVENSYLVLVVKVNQE